MDNWLLIIVGVVFLVSIIVGCVRGFFKIGISLLSTVLTIVIMVVLNPYISQALTKYTPINNMIAERCIQAFVPEIAVEELAKLDLSDTPLAKLDIDALIKSESVDWESLGIESEDILKVIGEIPKDAQIKQIEESPLPVFLKDIILENNNAEIYKEMGVTSFPEYVAYYISRMVIKILAFLITFLLAIIIVKALIVAVDILGELPVLGLFNRIGGAAVGALSALLLVWVGFLVMTLLYSTTVGKACFEMIDQSQILTFIYDKNILLQTLLKF